MRTILQCAICSALLWGCAPVYKFSKPDVSVSNFKRDVYECNQSIVNTYALQRMGTAAGSMFFEKVENGVGSRFRGAGRGARGGPGLRDTLSSGRDSNPDPKIPY
jgi:hypothetical protein